MAIDVLLPQWGMGMQEGTVVEWLKAEGDPVSENEPIVEIESEKTTEQVSAPASGVLARILVAPGQTARIYDTLAVIAAPGEVLPDALAPLGDVRQTESARPGASTPAHGPRAVQVEPRARRLAHARSVDLDRVVGTGPNGRITEADVLQILEGGREVPRPVPLSGVRAVTARKMADAAHTMAMATLHTDVFVTELESYRHERGVGYTALFVKGCALSLRLHPALNAHLTSDGLMVWEQVDVGVAIAARDALVVPVVRNADAKTVRSIAEEIRVLSDRVRNREATTEELTCSTFTVTNLGMFGITGFTPIVNPPEVAILGVGRVEDRATRQTGGVAWRRILSLSLTFDHRAVDGAPAAKFLQRVGQLMEDPRQLTSGEKSTGDY